MFRRVWRTAPVLVWLLLPGCRACDPTSGYYGHPLGPGAELKIVQEIGVPAGLARVDLR